MDGSDLKHTNGAYWGASEGPGSSVGGRENHPVVHVSWHDAQAYCEWAVGRLHEVPMGAHILGETTL